MQVSIEPREWFPQVRLLLDTLSEGFAANPWVVGDCSNDRGLTGSFGGTAGCAGATAAIERILHQVSSVDRLVEAMIHLQETAAPRTCRIRSIILTTTKVFSTFGSK